jgi:formylglycine-generating enzyme required for sulfatase activity
MTFSWIPPGTFLMGSPPDEQGRSQDEVLHRVTIPKGFRMGVHPVTQVQWRMVMGRNPSRFADNDDHPAEAVSWGDCQEFCARLSRKGGQHFRLPTEAEWEYVCRAGTTTPFSFGETISTEQANYNDQHTEEHGGTGVSLGRTTAVGSFPPNPWGLYDLHGNVWEWCQDWYGPYPPGEQQDLMGSADGTARVVRGGSWLGGARLCRSACRIKFAPDNRFGYIGCRVCLGPD